MYNNTRRSINNFTPSHAFHSLNFIVIISTKGKTETFYNSNRRSLGNKFVRGPVPGHAIIPINCKTGNPKQRTDTTLKN